MALTHVTPPPRTVQKVSKCGGKRIPQAGTQLPPWPPFVLPQKPCPLLGAAACQLLSVKCKDSEMREAWDEGFHGNRFCFAG